MKITGVRVDRKHNEGLYIDHDADHGLVGFQISNDNRADMPYDMFKIEDVVAALKDYPGLTISYEPPKRRNVDVVRDLPVGAVFKWDSMKNRTFSYVRQEDDRVVDSEGFFYEVSDFNHSDDHNSIVVIYPKGGE